MRSLFATRPKAVASGHIVLVAGLRSKPENEEKIRELLLGMRAPTHAEKGCIAYEIHQSKIDGGLFFVYQVWEDEGALEAHSKSAHAQKFKDAAPRLLEGPVLLNRWEIIR